MASVMNVDGSINCKIMPMLQHDLAAHLEASGLPPVLNYGQLTRTPLGDFGIRLRLTGEASDRLLRFCGGEFCISGHAAPTNAIKVL